MSPAGPTPEAVPPAEAPKPTRMLAREQQIGYVLGGVAAAASVAVALTGPRDVLLAVIGVLASALFTVAVRYGHRVFTAMAGFLVGLAVSYFVPTELAVVVFSGYLMMRWSNGQSKARRAQVPVTPAQRREAAAARAAARAQRRGKAATPTPTATRTPPANRRYTPPKKARRP